MVKLSDREWLVLGVLWDSGGAALGELTQALHEETGWNRNTVLTYLTRMEAKGLVRCEQAGRGKAYVPLVERDQAAVAETRSFLDRVYQGSVGMMMSAVAQWEGLSRDQIAQLRAILDEAEQEAGK